LPNSDPTTLEQALEQLRLLRAELEIQTTAKTLAVRRVAELTAELRQLKEQQQ